MEGKIDYQGYTLVREISNFIELWISVIVSLCYCYFLAKFVRNGMARLFAFIPIFSLFFALPLKLHSVNLRGATSFAIAWLSNFKLLLLAFGKGPLSDPSLPLPRFIAIACFPIRIPENSPPKSNANQENSLTSQYRDKSDNPYLLDKDGHNSQNPPPKGLDRQKQYPRITKKIGSKSIWNYVIKAVLLALILCVYEYSDHIHPKLILVSVCLYFWLEIFLATAAASARSLFGMELEQQFDNPLLSTSVQNFWGRRWNLVASRSLRSTIYEPARSVSGWLIGQKWASLPAVMCTFAVSAVMHEIILYYVGCWQPTREVTWFFLLHGACVAFEIWIKKLVQDGWRLPRFISTPMSLGFVIVTAFWLFLPQLLRCKIHVTALEEYALLGLFLKDVGAGVVRFFSVYSFNGIGEVFPGVQLLFSVFGLPNAVPDHFGEMTKA